MGKWTKSPFTAEPNVGDGMTVRDSMGRPIGHTSAVRNMGGKVLPERERIEAEEAGANGVLFAAAPELYEALEFARGLLEDAAHEVGVSLGQELSIIDAALSKAAPPQIEE